MRKFILHTTLFLLPVMVGVLVLFFQPINKKRAYYCLTNDCEGRGAWMYRRIFERQEPIDIAFLGSSHTINGINDSLITNELQAENMMACNLGYCRLGANMNYVLIQHLLSKKKPKMIVIEAMPDETYQSHPIFPYMAEWNEITPPIGVFNGWYTSNFYTHVMAKWMYIRSDVWNEPYIYRYNLQNERGFTTNITKAHETVLQKAKERQEKLSAKSQTWKRKYAMIYPRYILSNIAKLAASQDIKLVFLYIPPYGYPSKEPMEANTYRKYGELWIPPDSIFNTTSHWYDGDHLNLEGANALSFWVADQIKKSN